MSGSAVRSRTEGDLDQMCAGKSAAEVQQAKTRLRTELQSRFKALPWMVEGLMKKVDKDCTARASRPAAVAPAGHAIPTTSGAPRTMPNR